MIFPTVQCYHMVQHKTLAVNIHKIVKKGLFYRLKNGKVHHFVKKPRRLDAQFGMGKSNSMWSACLRCVILRIISLDPMWSRMKINADCWFRFGRR
jgi:hypothetical protein